MSDLGNDYKLPTEDQVRRLRHAYMNTESVVEHLVVESSRHAGLLEMLSRRMDDFGSEQVRMNDRLFGHGERDLGAIGRVEQDVSALRKQAWAILLALIPASVNLIIFLVEHH